MKTIKFVALLVFAIPSFSVNAESSELQDVKIDSIQKTVSVVSWADKGRTYVYTNPNATIPPSTPVNYTCSGLEFDTTLSSFESLYALALSAHAAGKLVNIRYDDALGAETSCRITSIRVK